MITPSRPSLPDAHLAFVLPVMTRSIVEEESNDAIVQSKSASSNPLPRENTNLLRLSNHQSVDTSDSQEAELTKEEIEAFTKAAGYFLERGGARSKSKGIRKIKIILSIARKLMPDFFNGNEITAETLAQASLEVMAKAVILKTLKSIHPSVSTGFAVSQLAVFFKEPLQDMIQSEYKKNQQSMDARGNNIGLRPAYNDFLFFSYYAIGAAAWPMERLDACIRSPLKKVTEPAFSFGREILEAYEEAWNFLNEFMNDSAFEKRMQKERLLHISIPKCLQIEDDANRPRMEMGHEEGGDYELYDQIIAEQELLDDFWDEIKGHRTRNITNRDRPSDLTLYKLPNPLKPHPITEVLGGSFSVSGGSNSPTVYSGQFDYTFMGPKSLPSIKAPVGFGQSDPNVGGPYGNKLFHPDHDPYTKPIRKALEKLDSSYQSYKIKADELQSLQTNSLDDSPDGVINRKDQEIKLADELVPLTKAAMRDAWDVHKLTHKDAARENNFINKNYGSVFHDINSHIKKLLWNEFLVPRKKHLVEGHLNEAGRLTEWNNIKTFATESKNHAQQDKSILATQQQFDKAYKSVVELENSVGLVDQDRLSDALRSLSIFGEQLAAQIRARGEGSAEEIANKINLINDCIAVLSRRDLRYGVILSGCAEFRELESKLMFQIQSGGNDEEITEGLTNVANQKVVLDRQIAELISQAPDNNKENVELLQVGGDISSRFTCLFLAKQNKDISQTYQQYRKTQASILEMENSDGPVDQKSLSEALATIKTLGEQLIAQLRGKAALTPESVSEAELVNNQQYINEEIAALDRRDARYQKILSCYQSFGDLEKSLLSQILSNNAQESIEGMKSATNQKVIFENLIADLSAQCPNNAEKNSELLLLQKEVESRHSVLSFCMKPNAEKIEELHSIRDQIDGAASPADRCTALDSYQRRAALLSLQMAASQDYAGFSKNFNDFAALLAREDSLTPVSIVILNEICKDLIAGVVNEKIDPMASLSMLQALEKKHSTSNLEQVQLAIGSLFCMSQQRTTVAALESYKRCRILQPDNPLWPRRQALCQLETLHYSDAEKAILEALAINDNEENRKAAGVIVKDKYDNLSLALEWIKMGINMGIHTLNPDEEQAVEEFKKCTTTLKIVHGALQVASHPAILSRWLPHIIVADDSLKKTLTDILAEDRACAFDLVNSTTIATRAINVGADVICTTFSKEQYPNLISRTKQIAGYSSLVQFALPSIHDLWSKYNGGNLSLSSSFRSTAMGVLSSLSTVIPFIQGYYYSSEKEKKSCQRNRPVLHSMINTLASKQLANALSFSSLLWQTKPLIGRFALRMVSLIKPKCTSETVDEYLSYAIGGFFSVYLIRKIEGIYSQAKEKILQS